MRPIKTAALSAFLCVVLAMGCGTDPPAQTPTPGGDAEVDAGAEPDVSDDPDAEGDGDGDPGIIPEDGAAARGELSPGSGVSKSESFTLSGQINPVPAPIVLEGESYELRVRPVISF